MKTDLYTKVVLTVIAFSLVCIVVQNSSIITPAHATTPPTVITPPITQSYQDVNLRFHDLTKHSALPVYIVENPTIKKETDEQEKKESDEQTVAFSH